MSPKYEFEKKGKEIKEQVKKEKETNLRETAAASRSLDTVKNNQDLMRMYQNAADIGTRNISGSSPILKVHAAGRSSSELADGSEPKDGNFFYQQTQEQFESITGHILVISEGFQAPDMQGNMKFNQVIAGVIMNTGKPLPFIMYFTGTKLQKLWSFGEEVAKYNRGAMRIPMFALSVKMTTESIKTGYGKAWVVNFEIIKEEDGMPKLVIDPVFFRALREGAEKAEESIERIKAAKSNTAATTEEPLVTKEEIEEIHRNEDSPDKTKTAKTEDVNPDDIPF